MGNEHILLLRGTEKKRERALGRGETIEGRYEPCRARQKKQVTKD